MSQPVKLSDALVIEARVVGAAMERSIAGQVEFWARLGKAVESLLTGQQTLTLGREVDAVAIEERLGTVDTHKGRERVRSLLVREPYPHYFPYPEGKGLLIREEADGTKTIGKFVNRVFVVTKAMRTSNVRAAEKRATV